MFKSFLRSITKTTAVPAASAGGRVAIYHNATLPISNHLLNKMSQLQGTKFAMDVKTNEPLSFHDYKFIINECLDMHPKNKSILRDLLKTNDPHLGEFGKLANGPIEQYPIIIDYNNKLLANDETSFDRIMQNYLLCGIQHATNGNIRSTLPGNYVTTATHPLGTKHTANANLVHPHVAEFADLF